ncbi:MAG: TRAP transporter large permease [Oscillospiraceae bacterium]|nr:TRAP transporter large permease [Oscillospiraceae bacterium]
MSPLTVLLIAFLVLLLINTPIAFVIGGSGIVWFLAKGTMPISIAIQRVVAQTQSITFLAVPFFIFAGNLMNRTGITPRLMKFSQLVTRRMVGGTCQVSVVLSTLMGGVSGSAVADATMEARILGPSMTKRGYPKGYSSAVLCLTSLITATIPPSLGLILYGFVGNVSIGRLFIAGLIPGILMCAALMITVWWTSKKHGYDIPDDKVLPPSWKEIIASLRECFFALIFPILLIVLIRFGICTSTEAGAFAVAYALLCGTLVYHELSWNGFFQALKDSVIDTGGIILIISLSGIFSYAITVEQVPSVLGRMLLGITNNPQMMMIIIILFLTLSGMVIDSNVNVLLFTPLILPVLQNMGVNSVHFGIIMMTIVTMGCMTPPVGTACYSVCDIMGCSIGEYVKHSIPFFATIILLDILLVFIPDIILFLPNLIYG